ncbi:hypothetical protein NIES4071_02620 [Calothrix sp. NIES-4071]|nr:hypothetical protein NIES4071_02620 [Calothrix sp. NIES-4071]BAZ54608.1 hypothetical protein NIES4105_02610 [Calothrix sp. NIES-4105]
MNQLPGSKVNNDSKDGNTYDTSGCLTNIGVLLLLVVLAMLTRGCNFFGDEQENITSQITNTNEITRETNDFIGRSVTIRSKPVKRVGLRSFAVNDRRLFGGKPIVVINASGVPFNLPENRNVEVQVTGQVRNLNIPQIERDFKLNVQDKYYQDYIGQPAIIARYIALAPKPAQVTSNPEQYYGRRVAVMGEVKDIQSPSLLKLDEDKLIGGQDLVVLLKHPSRVAINEGQTVAIIGEVHPFVIAEIERDYNLNLNWGWNLRNKLETEYKNTPVLVADSVYP